MDCHFAYLSVLPCRSGYMFGLAQMLLALMLKYDDVDKIPPQNQTPCIIQKRSEVYTQRRNESSPSLELEVRRAEMFDPDMDLVVFQGEDNAAALESAGFHSPGSFFKVLNFLLCSIITF